MEPATKNNLRLTEPSTASEDERRILPDELKEKLSYEELRLMLTKISKQPEIFIHIAESFLTNFLKNKSNIISKEHLIELQKHLTFLKQFEDEYALIDILGVPHYTICPLISVGFLENSQCTLLYKPINDICCCVEVKGTIKRVIALAKLYI